MNREQTIKCLKHLCRDNGLMGEAKESAIRFIEAYDGIIKDIKKACGCNTALDIINEHLEELEGKYGE